MREPVIHNEDPNLEYNLWDTNYLKYNGELFTGTIIYDDTNPISYTEYKNGDYDGESVSYHKNGNLAEKSFYKDGEYISGKEWYNNEQLKSDDIHLYDEDGKLIRINGSWLYPNGVKRNGQGNGENYLFSSKGELAIKTIINMSGDYKNTIVFFDNIVSECYQELLINLYPDFDEMFYNTEYYIWGWVAKKYSIDKNSGLLLYTELEQHQNKNIVSTAKALLEMIKKNELNPEEYLKNLGYHTILK
jgi:antitoxin component YwqK of YwqJK toxin-antitoxin module